MKKLLYITVLNFIWLASMAQPFTLDSSFNFPQGYYHTSIGSLSQDFGLSMAVTPTYDYYLAGYGYNLNYQHEGYIIKVSNTGQLITSFGTNGKKMINLATMKEAITDIVLDGQGSIFAVHLAQDPIVSTYSNPSIIKLHSNGDFDTTFGNGGIVALPNTKSAYIEDYYGIGIDGYGGVIVAGSDCYTDIYNPDIKVFRYHPDGSPDTSFGTGGVVAIPLPHSQTVVDIKVFPDGKIIVFADSYNPQSLTDVVLVKLDPGGVLSSGFGTNGISLNAFSLKNDRVCDYGIQSDGKIVISGMTIPDLAGGDVDILAARFNMNGTLDAGFGTNGVFTYSSQPNGGNEHGRVMVIQNDGKILMNGYTTTASQATDFIFARLTTSGQLDFSFGAGGILYMNVALQTVGNDMFLQDDGKVVLGGTIVFTLSAAYAAIFRFNNDISTDIIDTEKGDVINIYPTVFSSTININLNSNSKGIHRLEIYNMLGEQIETRELNNSTGINLSNLNAGTYLFRVVNEGRIATCSKLIKR